MQSHAGFFANTSPTDLELSDFVNAVIQPPNSRMPRRIKKNWDEAPDPFQGDNETREAFIAEKIRTTPDILLRTDIIIDAAGREFKMTALQYTLWATDKYAQEILLKFIPEEEATKQKNDYSQLNISHGQYFDYNPLLSAYDAYIHYMRHFDFHRLKTNAAEIHSEMLVLWLAIGKAQRVAPVHVINEYFHPLYTMDKSRRFDSKEGMPIRLTGETRGFNVYPLVAKVGLGYEYTLLRTLHGVCPARHHEHIGVKGWLDEAIDNRDAIRRLSLARKKDLVHQELANRYRASS